MDISNEICEQLLHKICNCIAEKAFDKEERFLKDKPKKNKSGDITNGGINLRLIDLAKKLNLNKEKIAIVEKAKKTKEQTKLEFQQSKYNDLLSLFSEYQLDNELAHIKQTYYDFKQANQIAHTPANWLTEWTPKAKDISFATHVGKLTHSSSKSSSVLDMSNDIEPSYLTTSSLIAPEIDTAVDNNASSPIADILKLSVDNISVQDCIKMNDLRLFDGITQDKALIEEWVENLKQSYDSSQKQSYFLSKQVYFPVGKQQYHLLMPLTSSSLAHRLHLEKQEYFSDEQKSVRKQRREEKYHELIEVNYPNKAILHVTQSNHSNASSFNGKRGGRLVLLSSRPPEWKQKVSLPQESLFSPQLAYKLRAEINELRNYLLVIQNKELKANKPETYREIKRKVDDFTHALLMLVVSFRNITDQPLWTVEHKLPIQQQLLCEPWRDDEQAMQVKINSDWIKELSGDLAIWLNNQLNKHKKLNLSPISRRAWSDLIYPELREFIVLQEEAK